VKILAVSANNRKKAFEVRTRSKTLSFPYALARPRPDVANRVVTVRPDPEIGNEGFTYVLVSGAEGTVHIDHVLDYNRDPGYVADQLLYRLSVEAKKRVAESPLSTREIIRRLGTSPAQFYRLLDQTNTHKSVRQMLSLLHILDCEVDVVVRGRRIA
jgi:hypothetical protein